MPISSGTFTRTDGTRTGATVWEQARQAGVKVVSTNHDTHDQDIADAINTAVFKDGSNTPSANLPMGSNRHTGVGNAAARTDYAATGQVQDGKLNWIDGGGTADAITATYAIPITALVDGQECYVRATAANATTTPTFAPSGLTARTIVKEGGTALAAGDIAGDGHELHLRYDLSGTQWELLNPASTLAAALTTQGDLLTRDASGPARLAVGTSGQVVQSDGTDPSWSKVGALNLAASALGFNLINGYLTAAVGSSALTIAIKTNAGTDPSATDPVLVMFRNVTAATGDYTVLSITAATSFVISSGSTMGASSGTAFKLWFVGFNDGGTFRLGAINCINSSSIYPIGQFAIASATAEGGAGASDSAQTFYAGSAVSSKAYAILGYGLWSSGLTTAGTWDALPTRLQLFHSGVTLPGQVMTAPSFTQTGAVATGTTAMPFDDTVPQITEGTEFMTVAVTRVEPTSLLGIDVVFNFEINGSEQLSLALFQDATAGALAAVNEVTKSINDHHCVSFTHMMTAAAAGSTTLRVRAGPNSAGTVTFNGVGAGRKFGGVMASSIKVTEYSA